jgi:hypothetical protein
MEIKNQEGPVPIHDVDIRTIDGLSWFIGKSFGRDVVDQINAIKEKKVAGIEITIEEYAKILNEDQHLKILITCIHHKTLKKIHFWVLFWSIATIISIIICTIYFLVS